MGYLERIPCLILVRFVVVFLFYLFIDTGSLLAYPRDTLSPVSSAQCAYEFVI